MSGFPVDQDQLALLSATRGGRMALGGLEYQRAFAVLRLVSMLLGQVVKGTSTEIPAWIRYEWAEDIDELGTDGSVTLWQCKHGEGGAEPSALAKVFAGFAPKWLWTPASQRHRLQFRLVTSDPFYAAYRDLPGPLQKETEVRRCFLANLKGAPGAKTDRAQWQVDADKMGLGALFDAMWCATQVLYVPAYASVGTDGLWPAENDAVTALAKAHWLAPQNKDREVVQALRALLGAEPPPADTNGEIARLSTPPMGLRPIDVADRLYPFARQHPNLSGQLRLIDRTELLAWKAQPVGERYVARRPEWLDVVRGHDANIGFFERSITGKVVNHLRRTLSESLKHQGQLRLQWLVGAPGAGKSTLALRVAAQLVEEGTCSVIDARFTISEDDDVEALVAELQRLSQGPRALLLLLDDPLGLGSFWPVALRKLSRNHPAIVVLAATPDFLLDRHKHELRDVIQLPLIPVNRPDKDELHALASLYPTSDAPNILSANDELLVLTMQVATNSRFDSIISGLWNTLSDGQPLPSDILGRDLPWEVAAFWLVVFFHRAYAPCPLLTLQAILSNRSADGAHIGEQLAQMKDAHGWRIFQVDEPSERFAFQGSTVRTMHAQIAQRAWTLRPARNWDVADIIAQASVKQPTSVRKLAEALSALHIVEPNSARPVVEAVARTWCGAAADELETRYLCDLCLIWMSIRIAVPVSIKKMLHRRVKELDKQSWLAALQLLDINSYEQLHIDVNDLYDKKLIDVADFSLASARALRFVSAVTSQPLLRQHFIERLWYAFDKKAGWPVGNVLLNWLLIHSDDNAIQTRLLRIRTWLSEHPEDTNVRNAFLGHLSKLSAADQMATLNDYRAWLAGHPEDTQVRNAFLGHLSKLGAADLTTTLSDYRVWLTEHPEDTNVRNGFLGHLSKLSAADQMATLSDYRVWLTEHPEDTNVRNAFLGHLSKLSAADQMATLNDYRAWLAGHPEDTNVRASVLTVMRAQKHAALPDLLIESISALGHQKRAFHPGAAALSAAATLDLAHLLLIVDWMHWAANIFDFFPGDPSAQTIVGPSNKLLNTTIRHSHNRQCSADGKATAKLAIERLRTSLTAWKQSTGSDH